MIYALVVNHAIAQLVYILLVSHALSTAEVVIYEMLVMCAIRSWPLIGTLNADEERCVYLLMLPPSS